MRIVAICVTGPGAYGAAGGRVGVGNASARNGVVGGGDGGDVGRDVGGDDVGGDDVGDDDAGDRGRLGALATARGCRTVAATARPSAVCRPTSGRVAAMRTLVCSSTWWVTTHVPPVARTNETVHAAMLLCVLRRCIVPIVDEPCQPRARCANLAAKSSRTWTTAPQPLANLRDESRSRARLVTQVRLRGVRRGYPPMFDCAAAAFSSAPSGLSRKPAFTSLRVARFHFVTNWSWFA
jgi:hypothetical protein